MARPRKTAAGGESAYERRIRRYLEAHPGASRQEARGHKPPPGKSEYRQRVERAQARVPGISRRAAAGHATRDERTALRLLRRIPKLHRDTIVSFLGLDRQADGTWLRASFDLLNGGIESFVFGGEGLRYLGRIADALAASGVMVLGAQYLQQMAEWVEGEGGDV